MTPTPTLALDFDGVLCDGLVEYFQTAWRTYCQIDSWVEAPPEGLAERFYRLRPVIETGWEMPLLVRALLENIPEATLFSDWATVAQAQAQAVNLAPTEIAAQLDGLRDRWITTDLEDWLAQHRFYPGVVERLQQLVDSTTVFIVTTKEQRFVRQLLQRQQVDLPESQIFGKEVKQPKAQILRHLIQKFSSGNSAPPDIWFVEDRLKTLQSVGSQPDLKAIKLFLADWGYNTEADRAVARQHNRICLLSLEMFAQDFAGWT